MNRQSFFCLVIFTFSSISEAVAQSSLPSIRIDGSMPLQYSSNIQRTRTNPEADFYFAPYLKVSASGDLWDGFRYSLYGNAGADQYSKFTSNNDTLSGVGGQLHKRWDGFELGIGYERAYYYDRFYDSSFGTANDFSFFVKYFYVNAAENIKIRPSMTLATRTDDHLSVERDMFNLKVDVEGKIIDRWWVFLSPRIRFYDYVTRASGRIDAISSVSTGLKYELMKNMDLSSGITYESRTSGLAGRNYNNMIVGVSLDFSYELFDFK